MSPTPRRTALFALAAALAGPAAAESAADLHGEARDLPPRLDAFLDLVAGLAEDAPREPAWRNPHAAPRPSPDRDFTLPPPDSRRDR